LRAPCLPGKLFSTIHRAHPPLISGHKTLFIVVSHHLLMFKQLLPLPAHIRKTVFQKLKCASESSLHHRLTSYQPQLFSTRKAITLNTSCSRSFSSTRKMSDLSIELTAPNGRKYSQPTGLFINNEWVKSSDGKKITSVNPT
jgi:hypothetical protein